MSSVVIEGMEDVISKDLEKHKLMVERLQVELLAFRGARAHEIKRKRHFLGLVGGGTYNDEALKRSVGEININIRHLSDKCEMAEGQIKFNSHIVDTLTGQLASQMKGLDELAEYRRKHGPSY